MSNWAQKQNEGGQIYWERSDGAYVFINDNYPVTLGPSPRIWLAYGPNGRYLSKNDDRTVFKIPRRWSSPEAAMKALDKEVPSK